MEFQKIIVINCIQLKWKIIFLNMFEILKIYLKLTYFIFLKFKKINKS